MGIDIGSVGCTDRRKAVSAAMILLAIGCGSAPVRAWTAAAQEAGGDLVIRGVTVIDGTGAPPVAGATVVVSQRRITAVGPDADVAVPKGARVVNGSGRFLIPGLWDLHVHLAKTGGHVLSLFLANGVTGVRDMGGDAAVVAGLRAAVNEGRRPGPRIVMAGPILESGAYMRNARRRNVLEPIERFRAPVASPDRARDVVDSVAALGADFIKFRTTDSLATYHAIAAAARAAGLDLAGHAENIPPEDILRAGQRSIEHVLFPFLTARDSAEAARLADELARAGTAFVPTFVTLTRSAFVPADRLRAMLADTAGVVYPERAYLAGFLIDDWEEQLEERIADEAEGDTVPWGELHRRQLADVRLLRAAGMPILPGTDVAVLGVFPGASLHDELANLVELVGLAPLEAIEAATRGAAELVRLDERVGTIRAGMEADLVLLDADPLVDIRNTRRIVGVVRRGEYFDADDLDGLRASVRSQAAAIRAGGPAQLTVPTGLYALEASVGGRSLPVRLELLSIDDRPWGRLTVSAGRDIVAAVRGTDFTDGSWHFAVGGPVRAMRLRFNDSVTGTLELGGSPPIPLEGERSGDVRSPEALRAHYVLASTGLAARAGDVGASFPAGTADGRLVFARHGPDLSHQTLMVAGRSANGWLDPRVLFPGSRHSDRSPAVLPDGSGIVFASDRPIGGDSTEGYRLWLARAAGPDAWADPAPVAFEDGWDHDARQPSVTRDGTLYFSSTAPGGQGEGDIWRAEPIAPGLWSAPRNLGDVINTPADEHGAFVAPDGTWMILTSGRTQPGSQGGDDLWLSRRTADGWSAPAALALPVNSFANEYGAWVSPVTGDLFFTSDRYGYADIFRVSARDGGAVPWSMRSVSGCTQSEPSDPEPPSTSRSAAAKQPRESGCLFRVAIRYSARSATIGSRRAARRAGR